MKATTKILLFSLLSISSSAITHTAYSPKMLVAPAKRAVVLEAKQTFEIKTWMLTERYGI